MKIRVKQTEKTAFEVAYRNLHIKSDLFYQPKLIRQIAPVVCNVST